MGGRGSSRGSSRLWRKEIPRGSAVYLPSPQRAGLRNDVAFLKAVDFRFPPRCAFHCAGGCPGRAGRWQWRGLAPLITFTPLLVEFAPQKHKASCEPGFFCGLIEGRKAPTNDPPSGLERAAGQGGSARRKRWDLLLQRMRRKGPRPQAGGFATEL